MAFRLKEQNHPNHLTIKHDGVGNYLDNNGVRNYSLDYAVAANGSTSTTRNGSTAPAGSRARTTHATGLGTDFVATGGFWVAVVGAGDLGVFAPAANVADLTDSSGGTPSATTIADCNNAVTGVDGAGNTAASKADVDARLITIAHNFATLNAHVKDIKDALIAAGLMEAPE